MRGFSAGSATFFVVVPDRVGGLVVRAPVPFAAVDREPRADVLVVVDGAAAAAVFAAGRLAALLAGALRGVTASSSSV
ncbi:hypothetical protein [Leifsonia poae]|uniref:hypothetical protein n=1 Tax=Leifsonia poae TaxID=110933 RepID=UPI001CBDAB39|nr:hypothetical protein [Leifsonia poae]